MYLAGTRGPSLEKRLAKNVKKKKFKGGYNRLCTYFYKKHVDMVLQLKKDNDI